MAHSCVRVAAMVVSEINERLSPKSEPPITKATIMGSSMPVFSARPTATGVSATMVPTLVPTESEMKQAARELEFEKAAYIRDEIARIKAGK